jgi:cell division protein ZapA (FtsZ GTPase activity inhibitor)
MSNSAFRIDVLGTSLNIAADADSDYLASLLDQYKEHIENTKLLTGLHDPLKLAVLSGFLLCDELEKSKRENLSPTETASNDSQGDTSPEVEKLTL